MTTALAGYILAGVLVVAALAGCCLIWYVVEELDGAHHELPRILRPAEPLWVRLDDAMRRVRDRWMPLPLPQTGDEYAARSAYFDLAESMGPPDRVLATSADPRTRAGALEVRANTMRRMAELYPVAFGPDPNPDEDGRDLAESHALAAHLLYLLWELERPCDRKEPDWAQLGEERFAAASAAAAPVLTRMYDEPHRLCELLDDLYEAVVDVVGGQAAETIACLGYPERTVHTGRTFPAETHG